MNGVSLHGGLIPYAAPSWSSRITRETPLRLAALMGIFGVTYSFSHDSIRAGRDGPTPPPVEHAATPAP